MSRFSGSKRTNKRQGLTLDYQEITTGRCQGRVKGKSGLLCAKVTVLKPSSYCSQAVCNLQGCNTYTSFMFKGSSNAMPLAFLYRGFLQMLLHVTSSIPCWHRGCESSGQDEELTSPLWLAGAVLLVEDGRSFLGSPLAPAGLTAIPWFILGPQ